MATVDSQPRRRFLPQPVETSTRSTKRQHIEESLETIVDAPTSTEAQDGSMAAVKAKPRKFLPQPVEESVRTSKNRSTERENGVDQGDKTPTQGSISQTTSSEDASTDHATPKSSGLSRRFAPEPVETSSRTSRRKFAVEPVETSSRTSKDTPEQTPASDRPRRKFAVEPVETSSKSSRDKSEEASQTNRPRRKFAPEPVETTTVRRHRRDHDNSSDDSPPDSPSESSSRVSSRQSTGSRKFSPELIETARGTYKKDPDSPRSTRLSVPRVSSPIERAASRSPEPEDPCESRFCAAALAKKHHEARRQHSYCIPDLPMIESESSSDESDTPSLVDTPSSTDAEHHNHKLTQIGEDSRESYTDYVLSLTSSQERRKLQEQAMAAYVNEVPHEPVAHFAVDDEDDDVVHVGTLTADGGANPQTFRRSSQAEHDWEMQNMRKHHEQLERAKKELQEDTAGVSRFSAAALAARHHLGQAYKPNGKDQKQKDEDAEYARMKTAASPPMLGDDIVFPYTISPKMTRCDVDQAPRPRRADSDDDSVSIVTPISPGQLWSVQASVQNNSACGLWMGLCQKTSETSRPPTPIRSGLQTPAFESANPFESSTPGRGTRTPGRRARPYSGAFLAPLTPARSYDNGADEFASSIDKKLRIEKQIEEEFPPRVITQIYNYLSLGFPSIARDFDAELSKISRISMKELRKDDHVTKGNLRGYPGTPESETLWEEEEDGTIRGCRRWDALRLYVSEWARQSPNFTTDQMAPAPDPSLAHLKAIRAEAWGATVRKGSWAQ